MPWHSHQQSPLLALPSELIDQILSNFTAQRDYAADWRLKAVPEEQEREDQNKRERATLFALCLVSKDLHQYAEPALYSWLGLQGRDWRDTRHIYTFLLKLTTSPKLGERVKYIEHYSKSSDAEDLEHERVISLRTINEPGIRSAIEALAADTLSCESLEQWRQLFGLNIITALVALLLERTPNIQHLTLASLVRLPRGISDLFDIFGPNRTSQNCFSKLQVLCLGFACSPPWYGMRSLGTFIRSLQALPQLRYLRLKCNTFALDEADGREAFAFPALRALLLDGFGDSPETLANMIAGCQGLQELACTFTCTTDVPPGGVLSADLSLVQRALVQHQTSLISLTLHLDEHHHRRHAAPLANLADFPNLKHLSIDSLGLFGAPCSTHPSNEETRWWHVNAPFRLIERLPPRLERLDIFYIYHNLQCGALVLRDLAEDCGRLQQLKSIFLFDIYDRLESGNWSRLRDSFAAKGVRLL